MNRKNIYKIERWRYHICVETQTFSNKKKAQKWLKESGWWIQFDYGECMIYIYKNNQKIDWIREDKGWKNER